MGLNAGFDMVPCLTTGAVERQNWKSFIDAVMRRFEDDGCVVRKPNYILFEVGEHPKLPLEGHKLLRFSSCIGQASQKSGIATYIKAVTAIAKQHFGPRVRTWNEAFGSEGHYSWNDVHESHRSYEQRDQAEMPSSIGQLLNGIDPLRNLNVPLFEIRSVDGKGRGLFARFNVSQGTCLLSEAPLLRVSSSLPNELEPQLAMKIRSLPREDQRKFLSLHNNFPGKYPFTGITKTNALPCGVGSSVGGVYATICLLNHSCIPNLHHSWNSTTERESVYAIRNIKAGEELTISYSGNATRESRRAKLKEAFGFDCDCVGCSLAPADLLASDERRKLIQHLDDSIGNPFQMWMQPASSLTDCATLYHVLQQEYLGHCGILAARLYYDAFQITIAHGDQSRASVFAERAYKVRCLLEGDDCPDSLRMQALALKPGSHNSFKSCSSKWASKRDDLPKGLDTEQFESWLWERN